MPGPIVILDPTTSYDDTIKDPRQELGGDPIVPLRGLLAMQKEEKKKPEQPQPSIDDSTYSHHRNNHHMNDISMSPRLLGYVFSCISSAVAMISSSVFFAKGATVASSATIDSYAKSINITLTKNETKMVAERLDDMNQTYQLYFGSGGSLLQGWKVYGSIAISGLITIITISIVIAHFDSVFCVKKNRIYFSDGSKQERNLLIFLIVLSVFALQINTSKFSVGEAQANVFFSTWTNFVSCVVNYEVWRKGSGKQHSFNEVLFGHQRHWFLLSVFNTISFLSTIDYFLNNNIITDKHNFQCLNVNWTNKWMWYAFANALICWIVVLLHRRYKTEVILFVRISEFIVVLGVMGINGYVVSSFTGGRLDQVSCPSNLYFSVWGSFFFSVWIFSSMIQESRGLIPDPK